MRSLEPVFAPRSIAVLGANERPGTPGHILLRNLAGGPPGLALYPVDPRRERLAGLRAWPRLAAAPGPVDLAIILSPDGALAEALAECAACSVRAAIVCSNGFRDTGPQGLALERQILACARGAGMRLLGPSSLGLMRPHQGLNASLLPVLARPGSVAFLSQSGALCASVLDWSLDATLGFSAFVSVGSLLDIGWGELLRYFHADPRTGSIVLYMESIGAARPFLSAAREASLRKPIVCLKSGRSPAAARLAAAHSGRRAGDDEVLEAALERAGVVRVEHLEDLFHMAEALAVQPRPDGPRLAILTNAAGPGVIAADELGRRGGALAELSAGTRHALAALLPAHRDQVNPVDLLADAGPDRYRLALEAVLADPGCDGVLVIVSPQAAADPRATAAGIAGAARGGHKPVLGAWMGGARAAAGRAALARAGVPAFAYPDSAARVFDHLWRHTERLEALYRTPSGAGDGATRAEQVEALREGLEGLRGTHRHALGAARCAALLDPFDIGLGPSLAVDEERAALGAARMLGYPVLLDHLLDPPFGAAPLHTVRVALERRALRAAWREVERARSRTPGASSEVAVCRAPAPEQPCLTLHALPDAQLGPVIDLAPRTPEALAGARRALALPPLTTTLARHLIERLEARTALAAYLGEAGLHALEGLLVRFAEALLALPELRELALDPIALAPGTVEVLRAAAVLHPAYLGRSELPRPAIRPYPAEYVWDWRLADGSPVRVRPIRPEDEPRIAVFHRALSDRSVYQRYFHPVSTARLVSHQELARICFIDYDEQWVLVVEHLEGERAILAVARLARLFDRSRAEFAITVADGYQGQGLGTRLLDRLLAIGRGEGIEQVSAEILADNRAMQRACERLGFTLELDPDETVVSATIALHG